ncbi:MAG: FAD-dependent monooxygenase [Proteobacteria bacterium]|nr:FAD-dependent monooxygenase [Pseudomonadota bacterium]
MNRTRVLISGGGIAGLTCAIELKRHGFTPIVVEKEPGPRAEGYMMDFFGTGWDVAERMGLTEALRQVCYPIDWLAFVDRTGTPYCRAPVDRLREALDNRYTYLRRPDLERILLDEARRAKVEIRYAASIESLHEDADGVSVVFKDGGREHVAVVIGADGVHSRVRELVFGAEAQFARFLGLYVVAFHMPRGGFPIADTVKIYEEPDRMTMFYPLDRERMDATYILRHAEIDLRHNDRLAFLREQVNGARWIARDVAYAYDGDAPIYFDSATQIEMPQWHRGRVALIGDACGCLTLLAGQGSHMAMAGGYVLARELKRHADHESAFAAYQAVLKPHVDAKRRQSARYASLFVPQKSSWPWLRRLTLRMLFSKPLMKYGMRLFGAQSVLADYR